MYGVVEKRKMEGKSSTVFCETSSPRFFGVRSTRCSRLFFRKERNKRGIRSLVSTLTFSCTCNPIACYKRYERPYSFEMTSKTVFVAGATGATGKCLVQQLLDSGHTVRAVVRSKERMMSLLDEKKQYDKLDVTEGALLDLNDDRLCQLVKGCDAVVSCLGHNITLKGMYGHPRQLVTEATKRLCQAIEKDGNKAKFILMGSDGVANPNGQDDVRPFSERSIIFLIRYLVPPHSDNEGAAAYLYHQIGESSGLEWTVVRPTDLIDADVSDYDLFKKPQGGLFGSGTATRANVAHAMAELITKDDVWKTWKFKMPALLDKKTEATK